MRTLRSMLRAIVLFVLGAFLVGLVAFVALCVGVDLYGQTDRVAPADVILILGAHVASDGQPGPNLLPRTEKAVELYRAGYAPFIICAGGVAGDRFSAAAVACRKAVEWGVPPSAVFVADGSNNTREDVRRAVAIMQAHGWESVIAVSHPMHVLRASALLRRAGFVTYASPTSTDLAAIPWRWRAFYAVREAGMIVLDLLYPEGEIGMWAYRFYYWLEEKGLDMRAS